MTDQLSLVFSALADPTRRDIVARLTEGDATVNELAQPYDVSVQAISKHLKVLGDAGLVSQGREGANPARPSRKRVVRPDDRMDRAVPTTSRGALSAPRRRVGRHGRNRRTHRARSSIAEHHHPSEATIEAHPTFADHHDHARIRGHPAQLIKAHIDPDLFVQWSGPNGLTGRIDYWDGARRPRYAFTHINGDEEYSFYGSTTSPTTRSSRPSPGPNSPTGYPWRR